MNKFWLRVSQINGVIKAFQVLQFSLPFLFAGFVAVMALRESVPMAALITLATLTLAGALVFINQLRLLLQVPIVVKAQSDIRFGIGFEGVLFAFNSDPATGALQLGLVFANSSREPIKFEVERLDIIVSTTTLPHKTYTNNGLVIPLGGRRAFRDAALPFQQINTLVGKSHSGSLTAHILYGRAGDAMTRRYKLNGTYISCTALKSRA